MYHAGAFAPTTPLQLLSCGAWLVKLQVSRSSWRSIELHSGFAEARDIHRVAQSLGEGVRGKVVIDATNPLTETDSAARCWGSGGISGAARLFHHCEPE